MRHERCRCKAVSDYRRIVVHIHATIANCFDHQKKSFAVICADSE